MPDSLAALVLSAGAGTRLRPLTHLLPKVLCPVGNRALVDWAIERVSPLVGAVAVNGRYHVERLAAHVAAHAHLSDERAYPDELGTAGAVGALRGWLDGRALLVVNGDTWSNIDLGPLVDGWDGARVRVLVHGPPGSTLVPGSEVIGSLVPAADADRLRAEPLGLSNGLWWPAQEARRLEVVCGAGRFVACDRPSDYLAANLLVSDGASVVGAGAVVDGEIERCVVWPDAIVGAGESLANAIRCDLTTTVLVRSRDVPRPT